MTPIFEYRCPDGHKHEAMRRVVERDRKHRCPVCDKLAKRVQSLPSKRTDGIYSYAPNIGNPDHFERHYYRKTGEVHGVEE